MSRFRPGLKPFLIIIIIIIIIIVEVVDGVAVAVLVANFCLNL